MSADPVLLGAVALQSLAERYRHGSPARSTRAGVLETRLSCPAAPPEDPGLWLTWTGAEVRDDPTGVTLESVFKRWLTEAGEPKLRPLAVSIGTSAATLSRIFTGKTVPTWDMFVAIGKALKMPEAEIHRWRQRWNAAKAAKATARRLRPCPAPEPAAPPATVSPDTGKSEIVIHDGEVHLTGDTAVDRIVINGGTVRMSEQSARRVGQIVVNGGVLHLDRDEQDLDETAEAPQHPLEAPHPPNGRPGRTHLRSVG